MRLGCSLAVAEPGFVAAPSMAPKDEFAQVWGAPTGPELFGADVPDEGQAERDKITAVLAVRCQRG